MCASISDDATLAINRRETANNPVANNLLLFNNYDYCYGAFKVVIDAASQQSDE